MFTNLGKSTLASFVIETLRGLSSANVLFFFCKNGDKDRDSFIGLARALIGQVVVQNDAILSYVAEESSRSCERTLTAIKNAQKILETCLRSLTNVYVVIDGLDECRPGEKRTVVSWFTKLSSGLQNDGINFRCLFSSQSDEETSKLFRGIPSIQVDGDGLFRDIRTYCKIEFEDVKSRFSLSDSEADLIIEQVAKEAKCE